MMSEKRLPGEGIVEVAAAVEPPQVLVFTLEQIVALLIGVVRAHKHEFDFDESRDIQVIMDNPEMGQLAIGLPVKVVRDPKRVMIH